MVENEIDKKIHEILLKISQLPIGTMHIKKKGNATYYYNRYYDNGRRRERYIPLKFAKKFIEDMKLKKSLISELDELKKMQKSIKK